MPMSANLQSALATIVHFTNFWGVVWAITLLVVISFYRRGKHARAWNAIDILSVCTLAGCGVVSITALVYRIISLQPWYLVGPQVIFSTVFFVSAAMSFRDLSKGKILPKPTNRSRLLTMSCVVVALVSLVAFETLKYWHLADFRSYVRKDVFSSTPMKCMSEYLIEAELKDIPNGNDGVGKVCDLSDGTTIEIMQDHVYVWSKKDGQRTFSFFTDIDTAIRSAIESSDGGRYYIAVDRKASSHNTSHVIQDLAASGKARIYLLYHGKRTGDDDIPIEHNLYSALRSEMKGEIRKDGPQYILVCHVVGDWYFRHAALCPEINRWIRPDWFDRSNQTQEDRELAITSLVNAVEACERDVDFGALKIMMYSFFVPTSYKLQEVEADTSAVKPPEMGAIDKVTGHVK